MDVEHDDANLARLEVDRSATAGHGDGIDRRFRKVMQVIRAAVDERDFYRLKSLHFEQLGGPRKGQRSMRLNKQWRLVVELRGAAPRKKVGICGIEDYH